MPSDQFHRVEKLTGECEEVRNIGEKDNPAFVNSWVNYNTSTHTKASFYKDKFNRVFLSGSIKSGTVPATIFTLPEGYRPALQVSFSSIDGTGTPSARINVGAAGGVSITSGNNAIVCLDGMSWRV